MRRYGPLLAVPGALAVGDPGRHHLRLTPDAVVVREGIENRGMIPWDRVERIRLDVPTTRFRLPGLVGTIVLGAASALAQTDIGADPEDGTLTITVDGDPQTSPLSRHHVGGYWTPTVDGAHRLLDQLIAVPEQRALLARPKALVDVAAKLARTSTP